MISDLYKHMRHTHQDSKQRAFYDWLTIGAQTGRRCEWASDHPIHNMTDFPRADDPLRSIYQCLGKDIVLCDNNNRRLNDNDLATTPDETTPRLHHHVPFPKKWRQWPKDRLRRKPPRPQDLRHPVPIVRTIIKA
jgi:hypothetical protein